MVGFKVLERSLGMISMLLLARLLVPADFGLVAMATSLIALLELFSAFGVDTALIQRADATREHYNSAWTLNAMAGFTIGACMMLMAIPVAAFYNEPRVKARVMCARGRRDDPGTGERRCRQFPQGDAVRQGVPLPAGEEGHRLRRHRPSGVRLAQLLGAGGGNGSSVAHRASC